MEKETLKKIFDFLEKNDNKDKSFSIKLMLNEPLTKEELTIVGDLDLAFTKITSLPEGLEVGGALYLRGSPNITSLPKGLKVGSDLNLDDTNIASLPKGLQVEDSLFIENSPLKEYTNDELIEMIKPGYIKKRIDRG
jgi:hypothetical protein